MITKSLFYSIYSFAVAALCIVQSNECMGEDTHWGKSVQGVQLSITVTNDTFSVGSSAVVEAAITNESTDSIIIDKSLPLTVLIKGDGDKSYYVTTRRPTILPSQPVTLASGEKSVNSVSVTFEENIESGDYTLNATQTFTLNDREYTVESNSIKVKIIK